MMSRSPLAALALLAACLAALSAPVLAADMSPPPSIEPAATPDPLAGPRRAIAAKEWPKALAELRAKPAPADADWNNLMGYTLRKQAAPDLATAEKHYLEALRLNPNHRGANEYLGELYLMKKDLPAAQARLAALDRLCPSGCEERTDLAQAIERFRAGKP
jgi:Flp pilus assembly protein TadD